MKLPEENVFELPNAVKHSTKDKQEKVGTKEEVEYYKSGSCFKETKSRSVTRDVLENISYREIVLPDFDGMSEHWAEGVEKGKESLWNSLRDWIIRYMNSINMAFTQSVNEMLDLVDRSLKEQQALTEENLAGQINEYQEVELRINMTTKIHNELADNIVNI